MTDSERNSLFNAEGIRSFTQDKCTLISISVPPTSSIFEASINHFILAKMPNLKHLSLICSILVVAIISMPACHCRVFHPNDVKLIEQTCRQTPNPNLCVRLLEADPRSRSADVRGLALIMVDVIKARGNEALNKINQLLRGGGEKRALSSCADKYRAILQGDVPQATQALQFGNPKFAEDAASDSAVEATSCEGGFSGRSPLTNENNAMRDVANVTRAIVRLLL
ncbi:Cell wall / vacuolar inhibitor of fructosidase 1 [Spatholobus suberectus]|nr:Cell wall / vacuolar inhibitor of fructosidase 1 [Spatholobus suberectus]